MCSYHCTLGPHHTISISYCYKLLFAKHLTMQNGKTGLDKARAKSHGEVESLSVANYVLCDQCELCVYAVAITQTNVDFCAWVGNQYVRVCYGAGGIDR